MLCVSRPLCVLAAASLYALAAVQPVLAQDASADDLYGPLMDSVEPPPPPPVPGYAVISSTDDPAPPLRRKRAPAPDPYAAPGLRQGGLTYFPTLEIGAVATSNVGGASSGAKPDVGLRLKPGLTVVSDWPRHAFTATASGEIVRYLGESDLSTASADAQMALRLDVRHGTWIDLEDGYTLTSTGAANSEVPDTAIGNRLSHEFRSSAAVTHEAGFVDAQVEAGLRRNLFEDVDLSGGGSEDNSDRNYVQADLSLRGTFNRGAVLRPFAEVSYTPRFHDKSVDRNGLRRDSQGYGAVLGLKIDDDPVWSGEAGLAYLVRDYEDPSLKTVQAPGLLANIQWRPTELTQVDLTATLGLAETASATDSATKSWSAGARVRHALHDNLNLIAGADISVAKSTGGSDTTYGIETGLEWKLNPYMAMGATYDGTWFDSASASGDYDEHRLIGSLILKR